MLPLGICLAAGAAVSFEVAYVLQAVEARDVSPARRASGVLRVLLQRRRWLAGLALAGIGAVLQILALRVAPLTIVQPVLALGIVGLVLVGGRWLGEPASAADAVSATVLAAGVALLAIAAVDVDTRPPSAQGTAIVLTVLALPLLAGLIWRAAPGWWMVAGAGAGDAIAAIAAKRLADAWELGDLLPALGWLMLTAVAVVGALSTEMAALRSWPATRVGPFVLVCQIVIPVALAPIVVGETWSKDVLLVVAGLAASGFGAWRLSVSAGLLKRREPREEHIGRGG